MENQSGNVSCLICQKDESDIFLRGGGSAEIVRCRNDGLLYRNTRPDPRQIETYCRQFVGQTDPAWFAQRHRALGRAARSIQDLKNGGTLLDIGCATGNFFDNFSGGSWRLYGLDTSPLGAETTRAKYKAEVFCGTLREAGYPAGFFDVVTVMDTLYYSPDPRADLGEMHRILKHDGLLAVEIPGLRAMTLREKGLLCWLLYGTWERMFANQWLLYFLSPSTMRLLLELTGFRLLEMIPGPSVSMRKWGQALHEVWFGLAWLLFKASAGKFSIAGRELYLAVKR